MKKCMGLLIAVFCVLLALCAQAEKLRPARWYMTRKPWNGRC